MQGAVTGGAELDSGFLGVSPRLGSSQGWEGGLEGRRQEGSRKEKGDWAEGKMWTKSQASSDWWGLKGEAAAFQEAHHCSALDKVQGKERVIVFETRHPVPNKSVQYEGIK